MRVEGKGIRAGGTVSEAQSSRYGRYFLAVLLVLSVSLLKSYSVWHYDHFSIDEEALVNYAVGFLDYDFNPKWFGYHTLPMYILYAVYHSIYYFYLAAGWVSSRSEFASLLFSHDGVFFVTAKLVCSVAYTTGVLFLARIIWSRFGSAMAAAIFFLVASIFPDSLLAANWARVDSFVFLFLALTVYFSCCAAKRPASFVLATVFATAAFCSKFPAIFLPCVLFIKLAADVYRKEYPKRYLAFYVLLVPVCVFIFMPYAFLDFPQYKALLHDIALRSSGNHLHIGKTHLFDIKERASYIWRLFIEQVGILSLAGTLLYLVTSRLRKDDCFPVVFAAAYAAPFSTSLSIDSYWYRPVYPLLICFTFMAALAVTRKRSDSSALMQRLTTRMHRSASPILVLILGIVYVQEYRHDVQTRVAEARDSATDSRLLSRKWINEHVKPASTVWFEGGEHVHYFPKVLATDLDADRSLRGGYFAKDNYIIGKAFSIYYQQRRRTDNAYHVAMLGSGEYSVRFLDRLKLLHPGDYVVTSSYVYNRYYDDNAMRGLGKVAEDAKAYYEVLTRQERVASFEGKGPEIAIYRVKETFR